MLYTIANLIGPAMSVLLLPLFTRYLKPADFGIFGYTMAVSAFLTVIVGLSLHEYLLRHVFECRTEGERKELFSTIFWFVAAADACFLLVEMTVLPAVFRAAGVDIPGRYWRLMFLATSIEILAFIPLAVYRSRQQAGRYFALFGLQTLLAYGISAYLIVARRKGIEGRYLGQLIADGIMLVPYVVIVLRSAGFRWRTALIRKALVFSLPLVPAALLWSATTLSDRFILERYVSLPQLGLYTFGFSIGYGINAVVNGVLKAVEPQVYGAAAEDRLEQAVQEIHRWLLVIMVIIGSLVIANAGAIVAILATESFVGAEKIVALITAAVAIQGLAIASTTYTMAQRRTKWIALISGASALASIVTNLVLVPPLGITGSGIAAIASSVVLLIGYKIVNERYGMVRWPVRIDLVVCGCAFAVAFFLNAIEMPLFAGVALRSVAILAIGGLLARPYLRANKSEWTNT